MKFLADGMLGSVTRKLRIMGFDVEYRSDEEDLELIKECCEEGRILLTSDRALHDLSIRRGIRSILVEGERDEERILAIMKALGIDSIGGLEMEPRCAVCNGELREIDKDELIGRVPRRVLERYEEFYECGSCGKVYWEGGHWAGISRFIESLERSLSGAE